LRVHFLTDDLAKVIVLRRLLGDAHEVAPSMLGDKKHPLPHNAGGWLLVHADLRKGEQVDEIRSVLRRKQEFTDRIFIVDFRTRQLRVQAEALGATALLSSVEEAGEVIHALGGTAAPVVAAAEAPVELTQSFRAFESMFASVMGGKPVNLKDAEHATGQILHNIAETGLTNWLTDVRKYHEGTFQHCLLVTGVAVGFALHLGFSERDARQLGLAATLHDVGKGAIPIEILDKPGRLDKDELLVMQRHPVIGYDALSASGVGADILEAVRHHHEMLDGSGYPDGLKGPAIPDLVRLLTISDIFAALIEARSYKPPMPRPKAYQIISEMSGKLEPALVKAFEHVALVA